MSNEILIFFRRQLKPDSTRKKYKTSIKWRNLNPVFNEEFSFETPPNSLDKQTLVLTVWDKDIGKINFYCTRWISFILIS